MMGLWLGGVCARGWAGPRLAEPGARAQGKGGVTEPFQGPATNPLWFHCPGPVDINIVAKCNACLSSPCRNNGTCSQDPVELYRCACPYGYKVGSTPAPPASAPAGPVPAGQPG